MSELFDFYPYSEWFRVNRRAESGRSREEIF